MAGSAVTLASPAAEADAIALVIGNTAYEDLSPVRTASVDARAFARQLQEAGFEVDLRFDMSTRDLFAVLATLSEEAASTDVVVAAYFGLAQQHGHRTYLLGVDLSPLAQPEWWSASVPLSDLIAAVAPAQALGLVLIDGAWQNGLRGEAAGLAPPLSVPDRVLVALSDAPDRQFPYGILFQGPFAVALDTAFQDVDRPLGNLLRQIQQAVDQATNGAQVPQVYGDVTRLPTVIGDYVDEDHAALDGASGADPAAEVDVPSPGAVTGAEPTERLPPAVPAPPGSDAPTPYADAGAVPGLPAPGAGTTIAAAPVAMPPPAEADANGEGAIAGAIIGPTVAALLDVPPSATEPLTLTWRQAWDVQQALGRLGFDIGVPDGVLGPHSRQIIGEWQESIGAEPTGFLSRDQFTLLLERSRAAP
ncbi:MAG: caspase family protein [Rhodospirillaceae bacterium]|nr:caspase family protein [Rhodospirillaceae bacterium]